MISYHHIATGMAILPQLPHLEYTYVRLCIEAYDNLVHACLAVPREPVFAQFLVAVLYMSPVSIPIEECDLPTL